MPNNPFSNFADLRKRMVQEQLAARGIKNQGVLDAMMKVERHQFIPEASQSQSYDDKPVPIGLNQTISQPYIVAAMTEAAQIKPSDRVLEIGTGCGYQTAILAELAREVYSVERLEFLAERAHDLLKQLGYTNIFIKHADGFEGWEEKSPFDAIIVTAAPEELPQVLVEQLKLGGRLVIPIGSFSQQLYRFTKTNEGLKEEGLMPVRFVPMVPG